ncbi:MAG: hypothetical protein UY24_C0007G0024 [Parcubacteria group bacterium GW2011_GWA1_48_11b]|uniref:Uncharacterized protein n=2 Tax=Parcubacteria group TaxID=1794811 RepID=A0A0G1W516_9BACT|nr:MAG: hypothetical protein UY02_C0002G0023 [Candidatus Giovannonibacteria bacterium GW2011_GWB1_47_6b]KKU94897.1 MAG: hypothetical protein UY24_C0007G0024 [Parcubacteria group bacterium GW2011_GWA1_48_11b]OGY64964.1 MAG: hypothetical protein A3E64_01125 [Candidatus Harrisonbacteria bacterium RIFCSPHIGHO2_12_FULL_48_16]
MSAPSRFAKSAEAREAGWVSRRHKTLDSRAEAVDAHEAKMAAERREAIERRWQKIPSVNSLPDIERLSLADRIRRAPSPVVLKWLISEAGRCQFASEATRCKWERLAEQRWAELVRKGA